MFNRILVATDGSDASNKALEKAANLSYKYDAELHIAYVINYQHYVMGLGIGTAMMIPDEELRKGAEKLLDGCAEKLIVMGCDNLVKHVLDGDAGTAVTELGKTIDCDLIICGSKGHSDLSGLLLGSVSHRICNLAPCSCLVVR